MNLRQKSESLLIRINEELARMGDPAHIRYLRIIPTPGDLDGWVALPVVELPPHGDGHDGWPLDEIYRYRDMVADRFIAEFGEDLWATCLFRTPEELRDPAHQMGAKVPSA